MFDGQDWALVGLTTGGTVLLFSVDKGVKHFALRNQTKLNDNIFNMDSYHGNYYSLFMASGIYGYGSLAGNSKIRKIGLHAIEAYLYSSAITGTIKLLLGRRRPYSGESQLFFKPYQPTNSKYRSLPSGHTTVSFAVSTVIAKSVDNIFWKTFWYGSAGLVAISRIYHNRHWLSDVFLGSTIGYTVGDYVVNYDYKEKQHIFGHRIKTHFALGSIGVSIYLN